MSKIIDDDDNKVFIATSYHDGRNVGFVLTWVSVDDSRQIVMIISKRNDSLKIIEASGKVCLNLLSEIQVDELYIFGTKSSSTYEKFSAFSHKSIGAGIELANSAAYVHCIIRSIHENLDRKIIYCEVVAEREMALRPMHLTDILENMPRQKKDELDSKRTFQSEQKFATI